MRTINEKDNERILNAENVLEATDGGILFFKHALPKLKFNGGHRCPNTFNPFYNDTKAGLSIYKLSRKWYYKDYGDSNFHGDVFNFAALYYKLDSKKDFFLILQKINLDLKLGLIIDERFHSNPSFKYTSNNYTDIDYKVFYKSKFSEDDLAFWGQYRITEETLNLFKVKSVYKYLLIRPYSKPFEFFSKKDNPIFAYEVSERCIKLYKPYDNKFKFQWIGEKPNDYCFGWDLIDTDDTSNIDIYITGGEKDVMTLYELGFDAFALNSETGSIPEKITCSRIFAFNTIKVLYDIDNTGLSNSQSLAEKHQIDRVILPPQLRKVGGKDISDYVKFKFPLEELKAVFAGNNEFTDFNFNIPDEVVNSENPNSENPNPDDPNPDSNLIDALENKYTLITDEIEDRLPEFLVECCSNFKSKRERDIFLISALAVLSGCLPKVYGYYDSRKVYCNLFLFIIAPPASNKSVAKWAKELGVTLHSRFNQIYLEAKKDYNSAMEDYNSSKVNEGVAPAIPEKPSKRFLFIPADSSSAAFYKLISGNEERGILFETEADILSDNFSKEWGNYNTFLRDAFHHETYTYARKINDEFVEITEPKISAVLTGTPNQVKKLIDDVQNGLFSRFMFYCFEENPIWKNVFSEKDQGALKQKFLNYGIKIQELYYKLQDSQHEIQFSFTEDQVADFNHVATIRMKEFIDKWGNDSSATIKRLGLVVFRLAMILTIIRRIDEVEIEENVFCNEDDFWASLMITETLMEHASLVSDLIPKYNTKQKKFSEPRTKYLDSLPTEFSRKEADRLAVELKINLKTAEKYLSDFINDNIITRVEHGKYKKAV
ncbi:MAG: DUF3987 domain-containing protein [Bacteroidales bacterium]|nr:DUF3987 domain-containing protein [Bacteroidales bacterium]